MSSGKDHPLPCPSTEQEILVSRPPTAPCKIPPYEEGRGNRRQMYSTGNTRPGFRSPGLSGSILMTVYTWAVCVTCRLPVYGGSSVGPSSHRLPVVCRHRRRRRTRRVRVSVCRDTSSDQVIGSNSIFYLTSHIRIKFFFLDALTYLFFHLLLK